MPPEPDKPRFNYGAGSNFPVKRPISRLLRPDRARFGRKPEETLSITSQQEEICDKILTPGFCGRTKETDNHSPGPFPAPEEAILPIGGTSLLIGALYGVETNPFNCQTEFC